MFVVFEAPATKGQYSSASFAFCYRRIALTSSLINHIKTYEQFFCAKKRKWLTHTCSAKLQMQINRRKRKRIPAKDAEKNTASVETGHIS